LFDMTEEKNYFLTVRLRGNNVDKEISVSIPKDEHINIERAEQMELRLVKVIETKQEWTLGKSKTERLIQRG